MMSLVRPETRYGKQGEDVIKVSRATDIFAIGSLIYEIVTEKPPYHDLDDDYVEELFQREDFSPTADGYLGVIIRGGWNGEYETAKQVLDAKLAYEAVGVSLPELAYGTIRKFVLIGKTGFIGGGKHG